MSELKFLLNSLLWEIYGKNSCRDFRKNRKTNSIGMDPDLYKCRLLEKLNINILKNISEILDSEIRLMSKNLERVLISKDKNRTQNVILYGFLDVIVSSMLSESSREMRFNASPPIGMVKGQDDSGRTIVTDGTTSSSDFNQWLHAMKMVARLPGGMPPEFRRKLWLALADKYLKSKKVDWEKEEVKCFSEQWREDDEELGIQIVKDLHRTGSSLCSGPAGTLNQAKLKRILLGYARYNPEVGYCQGFNMLGALILQVMDKEEVESIKVMIYLVEGILPGGYFSGSLGGLQADMAVFRELMTSRLPRLARHLQKLQGPVENAFEPPLTNVFTMQWFLTMFCTCLPMTCVLRVWDLVLIEGSDVLLRTALVLWSLLEDRILKTRTADDFYCKMGSFSSELLNGHLIDSNGLIEKVVDLGPIPELQKLRDKHLYNISPFRDKKGLKLYYSDDEGDSDEDSRMAVATAWGLRLNRRGSASLSNKTEGKERIALDISLLKKQYDRLRERQRQAHIILTSAVARQGSNANQPSIQMNQLLVGRNAIVTNNGRRLRPPQGAIPPARKPSLPSTKSPKPSQSKTLRSGETLHWRDTEFSKRRRGSLKWKDIKSDSSQSGQDETTSQMIESTPSSRSSSSEPKSQKSSLKARQRSDSSSYSEDSDGNSSTSTSLCDEDDQENCDFKVSSLEGSPFKKAKLSKKHSEVPHKKCLEDVLNSNEKQHTVDSQIPFIQLTTMNSPVLNASKTDVDSPEYVKEDSETESNRLDYAGFVDEYNWPDVNKTTGTAFVEYTAIDVTSDERDCISLSNDITSTNQLSPLPDIATFSSNSNISPLRNPISSFDYANLVTNIDDSKKFDVNDEGVTNEYFERINIVERPTKLDLLYSLNEEDSIRNAYNSPKYTNKNDNDENVSSECMKLLTSEQNTIIYPTTEEIDRKMKVLLDYSNKSSLSFIAEAKQEISHGIFKEKSLRSKPFNAASIDNIPSNDVTAFDKSIEEQFVESFNENIVHPASSLKLESRPETELRKKVELIERKGYLNKAERFEFRIDKETTSLDIDQNKDISGIDILSPKKIKTAEDMVSHIPTTEDLEIRFKALESNFSEKNKTISISFAQKDMATSQTYLMDSQDVSNFGPADKNIKFDYSNTLTHNSLVFLAGQTEEQEIPELDINSTEVLKKENLSDNQDNNLTEIVLAPNAENYQCDLSYSQSGTFSQKTMNSVKPYIDEKPFELIEQRLDRENDLKSKIEKNIVTHDERGMPGEDISFPQLHHVDEFQHTISLSEKIGNPNNTSFQFKENNFKKDEFEAQDKVSLQPQSIILENVDITLDKENNIQTCTKYLDTSPLSYSQDHFGDKKTLVVSQSEEAIEKVVSKNDSSIVMQLNVFNDTSETIPMQPSLLSYAEDHFAEEQVTRISLEDLAIDQHSEIVIPTKLLPKTLQNSEIIDSKKTERNIEPNSDILSENEKKILPVKAKIPSTEDLESRFMALERQFSEKTLNISQINSKGFTDQSDIKHEKQVKQPSDNICPIAKNTKPEIEKIKITPPNTENTNTIINFEISNEDLKAVPHKLIPTTADLEHRFKELERKLSSSNVISSEIPQQAESTQSNKLIDVKLNNEAIVPKGSIDSSTVKALVKLTSQTDNDQPPFIRKRIPSTEDLETRFKALEIEKSIKSPTSTSSNLLSPSAIKEEFETDAKTKRKSEIPSTKDLENRFQALERNKIAQKPNKETPNIKTEATRDSIEQIVPNVNGREQRKSISDYRSNLKDSPDNFNTNALIESTEQEGKPIPSTKDLETRFNALEQQKLIRSVARNPKANDLGNTIFKAISSINKQQDNMPESTENLQKNLNITPNSPSEKITNAGKSDSVNNYSDTAIQNTDSELNIQSSQTLESNVETLLCSTDSLENKVRKGSAIGMLVIPFNNKPAAAKNLENPNNDFRNDIDYHKRKDLYKLESQSDDTITMADPSSVEFEAKTESRPTSCPEYSDSFDSNIVTTDRVLKIIEENSKILHRILKKTLADTGGRDVNAQPKKSHPVITDSLLALGNIFPPAQCNETTSPSHIKSQSWIRPTITLRSDDNISDRLASIKSTIKSIDTLCEEKSFRKDKCQRYIDSLFARPTKPTISPLIKIDDIECTPSQERISKREFKKDTSPRRRRHEDREEYESRVRRDLMPNSLDAPSSLSVSIEDLEQVDSEVDRINHEKQSDSQINQPLSPYYCSQYDLNKRSITPVVYIPTKLEIRHTTVTSTFYDRYLTEKQIERTFPRNKKSPISPIMTKTYLDILKYPSPDMNGRGSKSAENSPSRQKDPEMLTLSANKRNVVPKLEIAEKDLHIRSCDNILLQLRSSTHNKDAIAPSIMVYNPLPAKIRKPAELGISLGLYKNYSNDETSKS